MGGYAYIIPGTYAPGRVGEPAPEPRSFLTRLLRRDTDPTAPRVTVLASGDTLYELEPGALRKQLVADFRGWLRRKLPVPSEGTQVPLDYVMEIEPAIYVRGLQRAGEAAPQYNLQVSFSGCAGEAETSARVAAHWAALWYRDEHERLAHACLRPFGFEPAPHDPTQDEPLAFLPAGDLGYLELVVPDDPESDAPAFELDYSMAAAHEGDERLARLHDLYGHYMRGGRCRCQVCEPDFGDARAEI
jgi:hypothetical protein